MYQTGEKAAYLVLPSEGMGKIFQFLASDILPKMLWTVFRSWVVWLVFLQGVEVKPK